MESPHGVKLERTGSSRRGSQVDASDMGRGRSMNSDFDGVEGSAQGKARESLAATMNNDAAHLRQKVPDRLSRYVRKAMIPGMNTLHKLIAFKPVIRQFWSDDRHSVLVNDSEVVLEVGWVEYFLDLLYVALFINLSVVLRTCNLEYDIVFGVAFSFFTFFWSLRFQIDEYFNYFSLPPGVGRPIMMFYALGIFITVSNSAVDICNIHDIPNSVSDAIAAGFIMTRTVLLLVYMHAVYHYPLLIKQFSVHISLQVITIMCIFVSLGTSRSGEGSPFAPFFVILLMDLLNIVIKRAPIILMNKLNFSKDFLMDYVMVPTDIWKSQERHGCFICIALGEVVVTLSTVNRTGVEGGSVVKIIIFLLSAYFMCVVLAMDYFEEVYRPHNARHVALRASTLGAVLWETLQGPLGFAIFVTGVSLKEATFQIINSEDNTIENTYIIDFLGSGMGVVHMLMLTMIGCHTCFVNEREDKKPWAWDRYPWFLALRYCVAGMHFIVGPLYRGKGGMFFIPLVHAIILVFHRLLKFVNKALYGKSGAGKGYEPSSIKRVNAGGGSDTTPFSKRCSERGSKRVSARGSKIIKRSGIIEGGGGTGSAVGPGAYQEREGMGMQGGNMIGVGVDPADDEEGAVRGKGRGSLAAALQGKRAAPRASAAASAAERSGGDVSALHSTAANKRGIHAPFQPTNPMHDVHKSGGGGGALPGVLEERESEADLEEGVGGKGVDGTAPQTQASVEEGGEWEYGSDDEFDEEEEVVEGGVVPRVSLADHLGLKIPYAFKFSVG